MRAVATPKYDTHKIAGSDYIIEKDDTGHLLNGAISLFQTLFDSNGNQITLYIDLMNRPWRKEESL